MFSVSPALGLNWKLPTTSGEILVQQSSDPASRPTRIARDAEHRQLRIPWADGHESVYEWEYLRRHCPCAPCQGELGAPGAMASNPILLADQTFLRTMEHVGRYAVKLVWGDGHDVGIYTFRELRSLCPCPACQGDQATPR